MAQFSDWATPKSTAKRSIIIITVVAFAILVGGQSVRLMAQGKLPAKKDELPPYFGPKKRVAVIDFVPTISAITVSSVKPSGNWGTTALDITAPMDWGTGMEDILNTALIDRCHLFSRLSLERLAFLVAEFR